MSTLASLRDVVVGTGMKVIEAMLEEDRAALCGPRSQPREDRTAYRYGTTEGRLVLGGRKVRVPKPRVRSLNGREVALPSWRQFSEEDPLRERVLEQMLVGVSTRGYARSLEPLGGEVETVGVSRSSVSRQFIAKTQRQVDEFFSRPLGELDLPVVMIDGKGVGEHLMLVALGIDADGRKHVLGLTEGSTESEEVCRGLLRNLIDRGLVVERARLFVIDGGKGIRKAIRVTFGVWALVQRCQVHKLRNIVEHLPEAQRPWVRAAVRRAWSAGSATSARRKLKALAGQMEKQHPGAAGSIREGLDETVTVLDLALDGWLLRSLCSTNPIENVQGTLGRVTRNVKRWRGGSMALRWVATALMEAERKFRRIKGHRQMAAFMKALEARVVEQKRKKAA